MLVAQVQYIDYDYHAIDDSDDFAPFFYKRPSYCHEREIRAVIHEPRGDDFTSSDDPPDGIEVKVAVESLVEQVLVSPRMPDWMQDLATGIARDQEYTFPVERSSLARDTHW